MEGVLRAADGSAVEIDPLPEPLSHWTSAIQFTAHGRIQEFTVGVSGLGDSVAESFGMSSYSHRLTVSGGELRLGRHVSRSTRDGVVDDLTLAAWVGHNFGFVTHLYNSEPGVLIDLLTWFSFEELSDGVAIRPATGAVALRGVQVSQEFAQLGLLDVQPLTSELAATLPRWQGTPVQGGELFRDVLSTGEPYFLLVGNGSQTVVVPPQNAASPSGISKSLEALSQTGVHWRRSSG